MLFSRLVLPRFTCVIYPDLTRDSGQSLGKRVGTRDDPSPYQVPLVCACLLTFFNASKGLMGDLEAGLQTDGSCRHDGKRWGLRVEGRIGLGWLKTSILPKRH